MPVPFSCPFLLWCSFPFLFFPFLLCLCPLIYICSFHGHSMCVFSPREQRVCAMQGGLFPFLVSSSLFFHCFCLWLTTFFSLPFLLVFFVHSSSFIYICCSFHGLSMCAFPHYSHVIVACREIWISLFSYPLLFSCFTSFYDLPFLSFPSTSFLPNDLRISAVVFMGVVSPL